MGFWLMVYLPLWKMMDFVSWDYCSQYMESHKIPWVPDHQPGENLQETIDFPVKYVGFL